MHTPERCQTCVLLLLLVMVVSSCSYTLLPEREEKEHHLVAGIHPQGWRRGDRVHAEAVWEEAEVDVGVGAGVIDPAAATSSLSPLSRSTEKKRFPDPLPVRDLLRPTPTTSTLSNPWHVELNSTTAALINPTPKSPESRTSDYSTTVKQARPNKGRNIKRNESKGSKSTTKPKPTKGQNVATETMEEVTAAPHFPYFKDGFCPPECACNGGVVQCSDRGVDKVPYGIPFSTRDILLTNNRIDRLPSHLFREYLSLETLVLSNNRLADGAVEGAFGGVRALKRLHLDGNLLRSVPADLPASLEELRLDNNGVRALSAAAWLRCPGLLVLSLGNNSLGDGSEGLPGGSLSSLGRLRTLSLDGNQLHAVPLGLPLSVRELYLRGNRIRRFRGGVFAGASQLAVLDLSENRMTDGGLLGDSLQNATHLESLNLGGNALGRVPRHLPPSLRTLNLEGNRISSVGRVAFRWLPRLEHLGLARNRIARVAPGAFGGLAALHQLDLSHNALRQVPRRLPHGLHSAVLAHNRIRTVPRDAFCWRGAEPAPTPAPAPALAPRLSGLVRVQLEHNLVDPGGVDALAFRCLRGSHVLRFY